MITGNNRNHKSHVWISFDQIGLELRFEQKLKYLGRCASLQCDIV